MAEHYASVINYRTRILEYNIKILRFWGDGMIGRIIEGRYNGSEVHKLPDKNMLFVQTEEGNRIALSKSNVISIDDVSSQYPSTGSKVMMVMWNDFEISILQFGSASNETSKVHDVTEINKSSTNKSKTKRKKKSPILPALVILGVIVALAVIIALNWHEHDWRSATCTSPKICVECEKTEGDALPHAWVDATCLVPKTCADCGLTDGSTLKHVWIDATCTDAKECSMCGTVEGEALGHTDGEWIDYANNKKEQVLICTRCGIEVDRREYQVMSADGIAWTLGDIPDAIYDENGFLISCNDFMGVYAKSLLQMPDRDQHVTQLNFIYDSHYDIKIMRDQNNESFVAMSFEGNEKLQEPMNCVSLVVSADKLVNNYTSYRTVLLNILGALPLSIDHSLHSIEEGTDVIVELINKAADNDISKGTVELINSDLPAVLEKNGVVYTLFVQQDQLYVVASIGTVQSISENDFIVGGACTAGESNNVIRNLNNRGANMFWVYYDAATDPSQSGVITTAREIQLGDNFLNVLIQYGSGEYGYFTTDCAFYKEIPYALRQRVQNDCHTYLTYFYDHYGLHFFFNGKNELTFVVFSNRINATS